MIKKLNNSDWIKRGIEYINISKPQCPFCQQEVPPITLELLNAYFDETYEQKKNHVTSLIEQYELFYNKIISEIESINLAQSPFINYGIFDDKSSVLLGVLRENFNSAQRKSVHLSEIISFTEIDSHIKDFTDFIESINTSIKENNTVFNNITAEQNLLKKQTWAYIVKTELQEVIDSFLSQKTKLLKTKQGLTDGILKDQERIDGVIKKIEVIESNQTSTTPTINAINKLLRSYGFKNFELKPAEDNLHYTLVRDSGDNARTTLSEGEKTFITFLYYYNLVRGSNTSSGITNDRIVVFDDPISSLDSDILFIVSSLIKELMEDVRTNKNNIKQMFFLTHNIYFHKELTFNTSRNIQSTLTEETFWLVRKKEKTSSLEKCVSNPIKTSYDLLWSELRREDINYSTIQNTMRRILENYFKILGGMDVKKLECYFDGIEKIAFRSLVSWVNDGSHFAVDDLYVSQDEETIRKHLVIFQKIFEYSQHDAHYKMMMGEYYKPLNIENENSAIETSDSANDEIAPNVIPLEDNSNTAPKNDIPF